MTTLRIDLENKQSRERLTFVEKNALLHTQFKEVVELLCTQLENQDELRALRSYFEKY